MLDRLLELRVPDQITLDTDELVSLLDDGVGALRRARGRRAVAAQPRPRPHGQAVLERRTGAPLASSALEDRLFGADTMFSFRWQVALHGDPLTAEEMDRLARSASPILRLRGNWAVVDPAVARKANKRLIRTVKPGPRSRPRSPAWSRWAGRRRGRRQVVVGREPAEGPGAAARRGVPRADRAAGGAGPDAARLPAPGADLAGRAHLARPRRLPRRRHGPRQDDHADRPAPAPARAAVPGGPTLVVCPASLLGNWEAEIARFAPGVPVRRFHGVAAR